MLTTEQLRHLANLAKLELNDEELDKLQKDLNGILDYVEQIEKLKLEDSEPLIAGPSQDMLLREDVPENRDIETIKQIIVAFPEKENGYLKVPKIIEK